LRTAKSQGRPDSRDQINGIVGFWGYAKNRLYPLWCTTSQVVRGQECRDRRVLRDSRSD
jgi:hypothetical protein